MSLGARREQPHGCAAYLATGESLTLVWANDRYLDLLDEPYRSHGIVGLPLPEVSMMGSARSDALVRVMRTGEPAQGEDRRFSVEEGTTVYAWRAYRPLPDHVLVIIEFAEPLR